MRSNLLSILLTCAVVTPAIAQRSRREVRPAPDAAVQAAGRDTDYRFTPELRSGDHLDVSNVDGEIHVVQDRSSAAEIVVHKQVRRGNGDRVAAVLEKTANGYRVCAVYNVEPGDASPSCNNRHHGDTENREPLEVEMVFDVHVPAGVVLAVNSVDGGVDARGIDTPGAFQTVDGGITYEGVAPRQLVTVDGRIDATITDGRWDHEVTLRTVEGAIDLTVPARAGFTLSGQTVDGDIHADFPITLEGKWGPRSFHADVGTEHSRELRITTVDGQIRLHRGR